MQVLSCVQHAKSVRKALEQAVAKINGRLEKTRGYITKMDASVDSGIAGATVRIITVMDERIVRQKSVFWANEAGRNEEKALSRAQEKINAQLARLNGEIAGFYWKFITPPIPKRTYATIIVAVNEEVPEKMEKLNSDERRERLAAVLRLLGNDPRAINLTQVAKTFGVSRDTLYKDLQELGSER
ncbi:MAG: hypothetical protein ACE5OT_00535 [Candidatus Hadarchaeaceae archaeon]